MSAPETVGALVIGAGPAGLMAAEALSGAGLPTLVAEAKPSIGRKFLMAGKSGLNLTRAEPRADFAAAYPEGAGDLAPMLAAFGPEEAVAWARGLGIETFAGPSGRVFPVGMKASPLLRAWAGRLAARGVAVRTRWRWRGWRDGAAVFETPGGEAAVSAAATVLALGGGSWARLGSDGAWREILAAEGIASAPFRPSNVGWRVDWSPAMARHFGAPVKAVRLRAGDRTTTGEFVISARGVEGGGVYALGPALRAGAALVLDLAPGREAAAIAARLAAAPAKASLANRLRRAAGLSPVKVALLREWAPAGALDDPAATAAALKGLRARLAGPRPLDEAISTAGGLPFAALDAGLMLRARPGVFAAGEMLDWDAPTGGYLLTACLATGLWAGRAAAERVGRSTR